mgnify:CR=1 FL=1
MKNHLVPSVALLAALALTAFAAQADDASTLAAMDKAGCMACHTKDKKLVGPSFKDIAVSTRARPMRRPSWPRRCARAAAAALARCRWRPTAWTRSVTRI